MTTQPNFGPDSGPYADIARQIREMRIRELPPSSYEDVVTMLEFMQERCVAMHDANAKAAAELEERRKEVERREKDVSLRHRALEAAMKTAKAAPRTGLFR